MSFRLKSRIITADKPANYYAETDYSTYLTAVLQTKPECMLIGGPTAASALVIDQARNMGYKGAFILIGQARQGTFESSNHYMSMIILNSCKFF